MKKQKSSEIIQIYYTKLTFVIQKVISHATKPFPQISLTSSLLASFVSRPLYLVRTTPKQLARNIIDLFFSGEEK